MRSASLKAGITMLYFGPVLLLGSSAMPMVLRLAILRF
jgi:hypothetical protein